MKLRFTRHGPVVYDDPDANRAYAIRTVISEAGTTPYGACLISMRTRNFEDFRKAMRKWACRRSTKSMPTKAARSAGCRRNSTPARPNWDGLLPVPGDGRYEWNGFINAPIIYLG